MGYTIADTVWPTSKPKDSVVALLEKVYFLADLNHSDAGERMEKEVFTPNAEIRGVTGPPVIGSANIKANRIHSWAICNMKQHKIVRVYVSDAAGTDIMLIGSIEMGLKNGKSVSGEFTTRFLMDEDSVKADDPRINFQQTWADTSALKAALRGDD